MSLYNLIHGENPAASVLLSCLGLTRGDVPRYRDCYWNGEQIVIHTRTGGGNREDYEGGNDFLASHECYVRDEDDDFDCTYANFYFRMPDAFAWVIPSLTAEHGTPGERWQDFLDRLGKVDPGDDPQVKRALDAFQPLILAIAEAVKKDGDIGGRDAKV